VGAKGEVRRGEGGSTLL
jgi:hypothetical protein